MRKTVTVTIDGAAHTRTVPLGLLLVDFIRDSGRRAGTPADGCANEGRCGACTVLIEGRAYKSCLKLAAQLDGKAVTTAEGLARRGTPRHLREALRRCRAARCGACTDGILTNMVDFLEEDIAPSAAEVRRALRGNPCRCGDDARIVAAVCAASALRHGLKPAPPPDETQAP